MASYETETTLAVKVNWLVVNYGVRILNETTDQQIDDLWDKYAGDDKIVQVTIHRSLFNRELRPEGE